MHFMVKIRKNTIYTGGEENIITESANEKNRSALVGFEVLKLRMNSSNSLKKLEKPFLWDCKKDRRN